MTHPCSKELVRIAFADGNELIIYAEKPVEKETLLQLDDSSARAHGEEVIQLLEGATYEYELPVGFFLERIPGIINASKIRTNTGRIVPGTYVGCLKLFVCASSGKCAAVSLEVRSVKAEYRSEYRRMLEDITGECTELLMVHSSPVTQRFTVDYEKDSRTLYQRFAFVQSIADSDEFRNAVRRVIVMPVTIWRHHSEKRDIRRIRRISPTQVRKIASTTDRISVPKKHPLCRKLKISSLPARLQEETKIDTVDTPENRFVKHVLQEFQRFCGMVCRHIEKQNITEETRPHIYREAHGLEERFREYLSHSVFREISTPQYLPLNSPILQRKEGYRKILRVWLMFDLAAKLTWKALDGGDQYNAGKRDVAILYEYWLFFKLLRLVQEIFLIKPKSIKKLIKKTDDGLGLQLRAGKHIALQGTHIHNNRRLRVEYSYNKTFSRSEYPAEGTWTKSMRPDYTLSLWPADFSRKEADTQEAIIHIHFDAKYRVEDLRYLTSGEEVSLDTEKKEQKEGHYKRADLLKMHAYKDAIRRTAGAYVLYPGTKNFSCTGFHEIIPGLGAFPISPSNDGNGLDHLRNFFLQVVDHVTNRASQREELSYHSYEIHKHKPKGNELHEMIPETHNGFRAKPPIKTSVLVGYYKNERQYKWICDKGLYNIRLDAAGPEKINPALTGARYLLLHGQGTLQTGDLWLIIGNSPIIMSKKYLVAGGYPTRPSQEFYLVYHVEKIEQGQFPDGKWDIRQFPGYRGGHLSSRPFTVTLSEMMGALRVVDDEILKL